MKIHDVIVENQQILDEFSSKHQGVRAELTKQGYTFLGSGVDQEAYLEPDRQTVLKIFGTQGNTDQLSPDQKMFAKWAKFCQDNSDNIFLPRYSDWTPFQFEGKMYLQIRTEKLRKANTLEEAKLLRAIAVLGQGFNSNHNLDFLDLANNSEYKREYQLVSTAVGEANVPLLINTLLELIHTVIQKKNYSWDLHGGNIMLRPNGQVVLNDPYVLISDRSFSSKQ
jgi:hypothetical protein